MPASFDRSRLLGADVPAAIRARRERALSLAEAAIDAVDPGRGTRDAIARFEAAGERLDGATVFAWGKAAAAMARAADEALAVAGGVVVGPRAEPIGRFDVRVGGHPDPAADAVETGDRVLARARALGPDDVALCLVSGGGSAMLERPRPGVSLEALRALGRTLRERGADIAELNAVRRALSALKGGGLARAIAPARVRNVILSDVPGHPLAVVASGPTCPPPVAPTARAVLERHGLWRGLDPALRAAVEDAPRWDDGVVDVRTEVAGSSETAREAVVRAEPSVRDRDGFFDGEARTLGARIAGETLDGSWVWGGETTVHVTGDGVGGRNQEVALGALAAGWEDGLLLAVGTDGVDGASDAAGALIDAHAVATARRLGLDPTVALARNDATPFLDAIGATLRCGPTGTNVADVILCLA